MLNARLYRTSWIVAGVALLVALLTLEAPPASPESELPAGVDGVAALELARQLNGVAPERPPGSTADQRAARWVRARMEEVPSSGEVQTQEFVARTDSGRVTLQNLYLVVPGAGDGADRGGVLVVAPRDTPAGVRAGASGTALMLRAARLFATTAHSRPFLFVSTDGSTIGNAGMRWFLSRFSSFRIAAAVVLDDPGASIGNEVHLWSRGSDGAAALGLARIASDAAEPLTSDAEPSLGSQLLALAMPQSFGDQAPAVGAGIPAVTISNRRDSPLRAAPDPTPERMAQTGDALVRLLGAIDASTELPAPTRAIAIGGQELRPAVARVVLLLLALPVLAAAVDVFARMRRGHVPLAPGARALGGRIVPALAVVGVGYALVLGGLLPGTAAGAPPLPAAVPFDARSGLGLALAGAGAVVAWALMRRRGLGVEAPSEAAAALVVLAGLLVAAWIVRPFELVLVLPAAHAALLATAARRRAHVVALVFLALTPLLALVLTLAAQLDSNPLFASWYAFATSVAGARGPVGVILGPVLAACVWSIAALVVFRARKGLVVAAAPQRSSGASRRGRTRSPRPTADRW